MEKQLIDDGEMPDEIQRSIKVLLSFLSTLFENLLVSDQGFIVWFLNVILPKGFKDRSGYELALKKKLLNIIEKNFIKFGFSPLETTPMELSSIIGNSLAEDDENPMADIFKFDDSGTDISLRYDLSQGCIRYYSQNYLDLPPSSNVKKPLPYLQMLLIESIQKKNL